MTNDMNDIRKSEFYSIIFNHVSRSRSNLMNKVWIMSRKIGRDDMGMVHMIFDKELKLHKEESLSGLYMLVFSNDMSMCFPELNDVRKLKLTDMNKCILFMSLIGFSSNEIADLLMSSTNSIKTMKLNIRKKYPQYVDCLKLVP